LRGGCAVEAVAVVVHGDHDEDGEMRGDFAGGVEGFASLVEGGHGFQAEHVHAGGGKGLDLLGKGGAGLFQAGFAQGLQTHAEGADRAGYPGFAGLFVLEVLDGLAGKADACGVDLRDFAGEPVAAQAKAICAEGVGFQDLRAGLEVLLVDGEDEAGIGEIELVVAAVDEDAAGVKHGAHCAVGEDGAVGEDFSELAHSLAMLRPGGGSRQRRGPLCYTSGDQGCLETGSRTPFPRGRVPEPRFFPERETCFSVSADGNRNSFCSIRGLLRSICRGKGF